MAVETDSDWPILAVLVFGSGKSIPLRTTAVGQQLLLTGHMAANTVVLTPEDVDLPKGSRILSLNMADVMILEFADPIPEEEEDEPTKKTGNVVPLVKAKVPPLVLPPGFKPNE